MRYDLGRFRRPMRRSTEGQLASLVGLGDGSTLSLDFTAMSGLDSRFTFTRASTTSTFINSSGLVATAGTNVARFDHDPTTLAPRGLLIEGSATSICTWSQDFSNVIWALDNGSATSPSVSVVSQTAPDGASSVNRITFNKTGGTFSRIRQTLSGTASATYTFSVWLKANTASGGAATQNVGLRIGADAAGFNCVVTTTWKRFSYSYALSGTDASAQIMLWDNIIGNDETADVLVWGAQLEAGSGATSYIPTGSSTVQRAADQMTMTDISALNFNQSGGTVFMQIEGNPKDVNTFPYFAAFEQSPAGRGWSFLRFNNSTSAGLRMLGVAFTGAGSAIIASTAHTRPSGKFKFATTLEPSVCRMTYVIAGGSALVDTAAAGTLATIGSLKFNNTTETSAADFNSVWISQFKYWPTVLPNTQLQALTS